MNDSDHFQKVAGKREFARGTGVEANEGFFKLVVTLRGNRPFIPRGVYRFKSFQESDAWMIKMMARASKRDRQP